MQRKLIILMATFFVVLTAGVAAAEVANPDGSVLALFGFQTDEPAKDTVTNFEEPADDDLGFTFETSEDTDQPVEPVEEIDKPVADTKSNEEPSDKPVDDANDEIGEDTVAPTLTITSPADGSKVDDEFIVFRGRTEPGAKVFAGDWQADVTADGEWAIKLKLNPGPNRAAFAATDAAGNSSEASITVTYVTRVGEVEFTAHQKYEATDAAIPTNKYYGTATPGAKVYVGSKYGSGATRANESGEWFIVVQFPEAPHGVWFDVVVESEGGRAAFEMVAYRQDIKVEFSAQQKLGVNADNWDFFWGTAQPGTKVTARSEYGGATVEVGPKGGWEMKVHFEAPAGTTFPVTISDAGGHSKVFEFTNPERSEVAFTANQKYGSCAEEVPYDVFWGTAQPGTKVWVGSPYGGGTATVSKDGYWEIRVEFPEAPSGKTFEVVIEGEGGRKVFTFTNNRK